MLLRHAGDLRKPVIPRNQLHIGVGHRDAIRHAGNGRLQQIGAGISACLGKRQFGVRPGEDAPLMVERGLAPASVVGGIDKGRREQQQQRVMPPANM